MNVLDGRLEPGRTLVPVGDGLLSALEPTAAATGYDRWPRLYDWLIPNRLYSRLAWGTDPGDYIAFAREAVADAEGPLLDVAAGTAVFTAPAYRAARRTIVVSDLSLGMLIRARQRLHGAPNVVLVQADASDPPFAPGTFATVACMGSLHVFADPGRVVLALRRLATPGGRLFLSGLVTETRIGSAYLRALARGGEAGPPLTAAELEALVVEAAGGAVHMHRRGSMAYIVAEPR